MNKNDMKEKKQNLKTIYSLLQLTFWTRGPSALLEGA